MTNGQHLYRDIFFSSFIQCLIGRQKATLMKRKNGTNKFIPSYKEQHTSPGKFTAVEHTALSRRPGCQENYMATKLKEVRYGRLRD